MRAPGTTGKKLLLVAFGLLLAGLLLALTEGVLALLGVGDSRLYQDPFVGFAPGRDLFSLQDGPDGPVYATNPGKLAFFNPQELPAEKAPGTYRIFALGGSTTAGRPYDATVAFPRWLELYLEEMDPGRRWEVINAGAISYASYRIVVLMRELVRYQPDLFVVLTGHNEFLEERTYSEIIHEPAWRQGLRRAASRLRLYNLLRRGLEGLTPAGPAPGELLPGEVETRLEGWTGLERYHRDPELARAIGEHFAYNLRQMTAIARDHGAEIVFVQPASNLKDFSPFKSEHPASLPAAGAARFAALLARGRTLLERGEPAAAGEVLADALALDPDYAEAWFRLGRARFALGDQAGALEAFIAAKDLDVAPLRAPEALVAEVAAAAREAGAPAVDLPGLLAADCQARFGHPIPGDEHFLDHVHPDIPVHSRIAEELLGLLVEEGVARRGPGWSEARRRAVYQRHLASLDREYFAQKDLNLATVLGWAGKFEEAQEPLLRAAEVLPESPELALDLGIVHQRLGRWPEAARELERAVALAPEEARAHFNLGVVYGHLGRLEEGVAALQEALRLRPGYAEALYNLGVLQRRQGELEAAVASLGKALELEPGAAEVHAALGLTHRRRGRLDEAEAALRRSLELDPADAAVRTDLAITLAQADRLEEARRELEAAVARDPFHAEAHYNLGLVFTRLGRREAAMEAYRRAVEADPGHARARNNLAILLAERGELEEARRQLEAAIEAEPGYAEAHLNLGVVHDGAGRPEAALAEVERAVELAPEEPRFHHALALLYAARGRRADALRQLDLAEALGAPAPPELRARITGGPP